MRNRNILQEVKRSYSAIAHEFDATRDRPWPEFPLFLKALSSKAKPAFAFARSESGHRMHDPPALLRQTLAAANSRFRLLDVGCGNGRLAHFLTLRQAKGDIEYVGVDNNRTMLRIAKKKNPSATFKFGEITKLPFPPRFFDTVWCIAVLHHLPTEKLRLKALKEMKRVLKKNGTLMLTVWDLLGNKKMLPYIHPKTHEGSIPWGQAKKWKRYYYAFDANELRDLVRLAGFQKIKRIRLPSNLSFICRS